MHKRLTAHDTAPVLEYIQNYWDTLTVTQTESSATAIGLPHPYVIPSVGTGEFAFREQYYWDTYFTILGIDDEALSCGMLDNLLHLYKKFGLIPNASRYYLSSRSQPPVLTSIIFHIFDAYDKDLEWLTSKMDVAEDEYTSVWMSKEFPHFRNVHQNLSRYFDINWLHDLAEAESGWDMTPRFKRQCLDYLPVDLNCLLYKYEKDFERYHALLGNAARASVWSHNAQKRAETVTDLMWHARKVFFFDYNYVKKSQGTVWSLAAYTSLWSGLATELQAKKLVKNLRRFEHSGGLATTSGSFMYRELFGSNKTQWSYPNSWAPLQLFVISGLEQYGYSEDASRLAHAWLRTVTDWYKTHGVLLEKYNAVRPHNKPLEGLYPTQEGFGWTNGVYTYLAKQYT